MQQHQEASATFVAMVSIHVSNVRRETQFAGSVRRGGTLQKFVDLANHCREVLATMHPTLAAVNSSTPPTLIKQSSEVIIKGVSAMTLIDS